MIIAIAGTPHSGKTVFLHHLYDCLRQKTTEVFLHRAAPDGEGTWSFESEPAIVKRIRVKGKFEEGFVQYTLYTLKQLRNSNFKIVLLDLGGLPSAENREILKHCDAVILLVREDKQEIVEKWKQLISEINIRCIGEIESSMEGQGQSNIEISDKIQGRLVSLDRQGIPEQTSKEIQKISEFLLGYTGARVKEQSTVKFKIHVDEREELKLIFVDITILANGGIIKPAELEELVNAVNIPITKADRGVVISGRLPVWAFSALVHKFHPFKWLGTWDPRLQGAVVVASHDPTVKIGEVVPCAPPTEK